MTYSVRVRPEAEADIDDARAWYESKRRGLGDELLGRLADCIRSIAANPLACQVVHRDVRRALVRRFPYAVLFLIRADELVILAVFHASRNPSVWKRRG